MKIYTEIKAIQKDLAILINSLEESLDNQDEDTYTSIDRVIAWINEADRSLDQALEYIPYVW